MFGQLQVLSGDFPPFQQIPVKQHFVQVSVLWQPGPPPGAAEEVGWERVALQGLSDQWRGEGNGPQQEEAAHEDRPLSPWTGLWEGKGHQQQ